MLKYVATSDVTVEIIYINWVGKLLQWLFDYIDTGFVQIKDDDAQKVFVQNRIVVLKLPFSAGTGIPITTRSVIMTIDMPKKDRVEVFTYSKEGHS